MAEPLTIRLFGHFEAFRGERPLSGLHLREGERVLAFLLLRAGEPVLARDLAKVFWPGEAYVNADGQGDFPSVRQALRAIRTALDEDAGRLTRPFRGAVQFDASGISADLHEFSRLTRIENDGGAAAQEAVALYRGTLLSDWTDSWVLEARKRLQRRYENILRQLTLHAREAGNAAEEEQFIRFFLDSQPVDEEMGRGLLRLLSATDRHAEARMFLNHLQDAIAAENRTLEPDTLVLAEEIRRMAEKVQPRIQSQRSDLAPTSVAAQPSVGTGAAQTPSPPLVFDTSDLETAGGAVPIHSRFYVERAEDAIFHAALQRGDSIVLVKGARQVGKTSLLARGMQKARETGSRVVLTDFQKLNTSQLASPDALYAALASMIAHKIGIPFSARDLLEEDAGPNWRMEQFFLRQVFPHFPEPLIWGMDEVDRLFACPFGSEVFGLFRSWHNERALDPTSEFSRLTLAIAYATEAQLFITDLNQSPFNVGTRLTLADFTMDQIAELNYRHGSPLDRDALAHFETLVGGQPYLVRRGLNEAVNGASIHEILAKADSDEGIFADHLRRLWTSLIRSPDLVNVLRALLTGEGPPAHDAFYRLRAAGILAGPSAQEADFRCRLYASYFARQFGTDRVKDSIA